MEVLEEKVHKNRWLILLGVVTMTFMACLDSSIVSVALPVMSKEISVDMSSSQWVVTVYLVVISALINVSGRLGDIIGKTKVFRFGVFFFVIGSLLCGISNSLTALVISRAIQGIGASGTMSNSFGIITQVFPENERGRALGIQSTFVAFGTLAGPPLGGFIVSWLNWSYIFLINIPIGIVALFLGWKAFPRGRGVEEKIDVAGAALLALTTVILFITLGYGQKAGYGNPRVISGLAVSAAALAAFMLLEAKLEMPLIKLQLFRHPVFAISVACVFISSAATGFLNIIHPFYLQDVLKLSPAAAGLFMMLPPLVLAVSAPASGYLSDKIGSNSLTLLGLCITAAGLFMMSTLNEYSNLYVMTAYTGIISLGNGLFQSPNTVSIMSSVPRTNLGIAGSINAFVRNIGTVLGIALSTGILYGLMSHKLGYRVYGYVEGRSDVFVFGMKYVYIAAAFICLSGVGVTALKAYREMNAKEKVLEEKA